MAINQDYLDKKKLATGTSQLRSSLNSYGNRFAGNFDPNTSEGLYNLALQQGGDVGRIAEELANPRRTLLSSAWDTIKHAGSEVLDFLDTGNQTVAGIINYASGTNQLSLSDNIKKSLKEDISISESLLGKYNGKNKTGVQKVGDFVFRLGIDILLDPTTYLSFGTSGVTKLRATGKIAEEMGIRTGAKVAVSKQGKGLFEFIGDSVKGTATAEAREKLIKEGFSEELIDSGVKSAVKDASKFLDSKVIQPDIARAAMRNLVEMNPGLAKQVLEKGGVRFFGKTILEGEKIRHVINNIPVVKKIDGFTLPIRQAIAAPFDTSIRKLPNGGGFAYVPEEFQVAHKKLNKLARLDPQKDIVNFFQKIQNDFGVKTKDEVNQILDDLMTGKSSADPKMKQLYDDYHGLLDDAYIAMRGTGKATQYLANVIPSPITKTKAKEAAMEFKTGALLRETQDSAKQKLNVRFTDSSNSDNIKIGIDGMNSLEQTSKKAEMLRLSDDLSIAESKLDETISEADFKINEAKEQLQLKYKTELANKTKDIFTKAGVKNTKAAVDFVSEFAGKINVNKTVQERLNTSYQNGLLIKQIKEASPEVKKRIISKLSLEGVDINLVNKALRDATGESLSEGAKKKTKKELVKTIKEIDKETDDLFRSMTKMQLDDKSLKKLTEKIKSQLEAGEGTKRLSDTIIKNKQLIEDAIFDNRIARQAYKIDTEKISVAIEKQVDVLQKRIDEVLKSKRENASVIAKHLNEQIDDIRLGNLENIYIENETGNVFFREAGTLEDTLALKGIGNSSDIDWVETITQKTLRDYSQSAAVHLTNDFARYGVSKSQAPEHFRGLNLTKSFTDELGEDIVFDPEIADNLEHLHKQLTKAQPEANIIIDKLDDLTSIWKSSVTSWSPAFHSRNAISNVLLNFTDMGVQAFNPKTWSESFSIIKNNMELNDIERKLALASEGSEDFISLKAKQNKLLDKHFMTDNRGNAWTLGQLRQVMVDRDIAFTDTSTAVVFDELKRGNKLAGDAAFQKSAVKDIKSYVPVYTNFFLFKYGRKTGELIENQGRLVNFLGNLKATGDVEMAASRTKQFLFDYSNLTDFERKVMRRIIPFYSFTRFNLEAQAKALYHTPGRVTQQLHAAKNFSKVFSQDDLTEEEKEMLPSWMKRGFYALRKQKDGTLKSVGFADIPFEQPFEAFAARGILGSISPFVRSPIEQLTGYDMYQGKMISDVTNATAYKHAPQVIKDYIGYFEYDYLNPKTGKNTTYSVSLRPSRMNIVNNLPPTSRVISSMRQISDSRTTDKQKILSLLTGTNFSDVNMESIMAKEEKENKLQLEKLLQNAHAIYQFKKNIVAE